MNGEFRLKERVAKLEAEADAARLNLRTLTARHEAFRSVIYDHIEGLLKKLRTHEREGRS